MNNNDLKFFNWNVRGLNCAARREAVKLLIQQAHRHIVCLQETKLSQIDRQLSTEFLGHAHWAFDYLPADDTRGGIAVAWNRDFSGDQQNKRQYSMTMKMTLNLMNSSFWLTTVYGPSEDSGKMDFLAELINCQPAQSDPWVCLGDFNLIYEARDKNNANLNCTHMRRFRQALDASDLIELRLQNR